MAIEPETKTRFRYESEGGSHGGLTGRNKVNGKKTFPTVKLENYSGSSKDIFIRVSLYTEKKTEHVLTFKKKKSSESQNYLDENLRDDYSAEFKNLTILSKKKEEIYEILMDRRFRSSGRNSSRNAREKFEVENREVVKKEAKEILNSTILCFEAFERCRPDVQICPPLYSDPICNQKASSKGDLKIHRMSKVFGSWKGEEEMILLCDKVQKDNIKIVFYEKDVEDGWKAYASFNPADVHYQVAIPFKTPRYKENVEREVVVSVALERQDELSEPRSFTYIPDVSLDYPSKKRKMGVPDTLSPMTVSSPDSSNSGNIFESSISDESQLAMEVLDISLGQIPENGNSLDPTEILNGGHDPFLSDGTMVRGMEDAFEILSNLHSIENENMDFPMLERGCYDLLFTPVCDIQMDVGKIERQMTSLKIGDSKPVYNKEPISLKSSANQREKLKKYLHLISKRDSTGNTLLHLAVLHNKSIGIVMQMNEMANSDIINVQNCYKQTALHIAVEKKSDMVKNLLANGGNPNIKNAIGNNCYHIASQSNFEELMSDLLTYSLFPSEVNEFNYEGLTPLHIAIMKGSSGCFDLLRQNFKANFRVREPKCDRSLLHYAVEYQPSFIFPILYEEKIDVNIQDSEGNTPLHIACAAGDYETVKQLLLADADPLVRNYKPNIQDSEEENSDDETPEGQTPADVTTNKEILELLKQACNKDRSGLIGSTSNSESETLLQNLCKLLDANMKWKSVATFVLDEKYFDSLKCSPSPTRTLLEYMKKKSGEGYIESFKTVLEAVGFTDAVQMILDSDEPLTVL